eukprot:scaffold22442_cov37-Prasinocladus_malaysianus.AAC.1
MMPRHNTSQHSSGRHVQEVRCMSLITCESASQAAGSQTALVELGEAKFIKGLLCRTDCSGQLQNLTTAQDSRKHGVTPH